MEWSERRDEIVSEDMLRDKGVLRLRSEAKCLSRGGSARSELGELLLLYFDKYSSSKNCPNVWPFCNVWVITQ